MKRLLAIVLCLCATTPAAASILAIGESGDMYDVTAPMWRDAVCGGQDRSLIYLDTIGSLTLGPVDGQTNSLGQTWYSYDATVEMSFGNKLVSQTNTFADDYFYPEVTTTLPPSTGFLMFSVDATLSDLETDRFFTPIDNFIGQIFTRIGDFDHDGYWEVLQLDGSGIPYYAETGSAIPLIFQLQIVTSGSYLDVRLNYSPIFVGSVIDTGPFGGPGLSSTLTSAEFESANNSGGAGSVATYDNVAIRIIPDPSTLVLMGTGAVMALRLGGLKLARRLR